MRKELIIVVPQGSAKKSVSHWTGGDNSTLDYGFDPYNLDNTSLRITNFVNSSLAELNINLNNSISTFLNETVSNAYDSYVSRSTIPTDPLILKIVIKEVRKKVVVKIMDNGVGFKNQDRGVLFTRADIREEPKDKNKFIGGLGRGLVNLETSLERVNGMLFFKNRKATGASVYLCFDKPKNNKGKANCQIV